MMLLLPLLGLFLLVKIPMWINDSKLDGMIGRFERHPLPPRSKWLDRGAADGSIALRGNGNHCDYQARFIISTELTAHEVQDYYDRADIPGIQRGRPATVSVWKPRPMEQTAYDHRAMIVELFDSTGPGWDVRCH